MLYRYVYLKSQFHIKLVSQVDQFFTLRHIPTRSAINMIITVHMYMCRRTHLYIISSANVNITFLTRILTIICIAEGAMCWNMVMVSRVMISIHIWVSRSVTFVIKIGRMHHISWTWMRCDVDHFVVVVVGNCERSFRYRTVTLFC